MKAHFQIQLGFATATDNCDPSVVITYSDVLSEVLGGLPPVPLQRMLMECPVTPCDQNGDEDESAT